VSDSVKSSERSLTSLRSCALLMLVVLVMLTSLASAINGYRFGSPGVIAAIVAGVTVSSGMVAALWLSSLARRDRRALQYGLASQLVRLGLPLAGALVLEQMVPQLAVAGLFGCVLGIYLPALLVETWLAVRMIGPGPALAKREVCHG
jgi:hypothetical protein